MSYIGRGLQSGAFRQLDDISSGFDGSDTTHTMQVNSTNVTVGDVNQILLSLGGVIQKPGTDFTVSGSVLTFTTAPAANTSFFAILLGSDNGGTVTPTDGSVTGDKVASTGAFTIGAAGTASSLAGISFYKADNSIYTHDVSGTDSTAEFNTAFGVNALDAITTGDKNIAIGYNAGTAVTEAVGNVLIGEAAGAALTTGGSNTLIGRLAGDAFDTEANNIAIGVTALSGAVAGGEYNVGIGNYSLLALTSADYVTAVGNNAGTAITTGGKHILIGHNAGSGLTTSSGSCVYIGTGAGSGSNNDAETNNIGIGEDTIGAAGNTINGAEYNVAIGNLSLDALTTADENTCVGYQAGTAITTGKANTLIGKNAGHSITTGYDNIVLGTGDTSTPAGDTHNSLMIGYGIDGKGDDTGFIYVGGSGSIYQGNNNSAWATTSDERVKKNIKDYEKGLDEINKLKVRTFDFRRCDEMPLGKNNIPLETTEMSEDPQVGLIAQEVQSIFPDTVKECDRTGRLTLQNDEYTWALIKAVQELSAKVKALEEA